MNGDTLTLLGLSGSWRAGAFNIAVLRRLETRPWFGGRLPVSRTAGRFDGDGQLTDEGTEKKLREYFTGIAGDVRFQS